LNLLAIPAIVLVYYFKRYDVTRNGIIKAVLVAIAILGSIMYIIIPGLVQVATWFELLFTNTMGFHYNTGLMIYVVLLLGLLSFGIYRTQFQKQNVLINTILVSLTVIIIGYSSDALNII
jgi:hypothetical protein